LQQQYGELLVVVEWFFTITFTLEYVLRLVSVQRPLRYARSQVLQGLRGRALIPIQDEYTDAMRRSEDRNIYVDPISCPSFFRRFLEFYRFASHRASKWCSPRKRGNPWLMNG
jgi:hypothetical protein